MTPQRRMVSPGIGSFLLLTLTVFVVWASLFDIDQIVRAQGQVITQDRTQVIQAADGGVLKELRVVEGEAVRKGQLLALLESERATAGADDTRNRIAALEISKLRALAEAQQTTPVWGDYRRRYPGLVQMQDLLHQQNRMALQQDVKAFQEQLRLSQEEYQLNARLYTDGDIGRVELMRAERQVIEARQKLDSVQERFRAEASKELTKIEEEITSQHSKLQERQSVLDHTALQAPADGIVKSLRLNTLGGVLRQGDELMQISPTDGPYLVEARINPADIGQLSLGQSVTLKLDAFDFSIYGSLRGHLSYLSPDTLTDQGLDGKPATYYRARVLIAPPQRQDHLQLEHIKPGMAVTLDILTHQRSVLTYITKPIARAFSGALGQR